MYALVIIAAVVAVLVGPQLWAAHAIRRHSGEIDLPGTGGELAGHLLKTHGIENVKVEITHAGDHYDPRSKTVRLSEANYFGKSLTAIAVAAHEVGHAMQDHAGYAPLKTRSALVEIVSRIEKAGPAAMLLIPVVAGITRSPSAGLFMFAIGVVTLGTGALAHLVTLPVEWDASFGRALPTLESGGYIPEGGEAAVREILTACALTYVAGSLYSVINVWRWIAILRR